MDAPFKRPDVRVRAERSVIGLSIELVGGTRSLSADGKRPTRLTITVAPVFTSVNGVAE